MPLATTLHLLSIVFIAAGGVTIFLSVILRTQGSLRPAPSEPAEDSPLGGRSQALLGLFALLDGLLLQFIATLETISH